MLFQNPKIKYKDSTGAWVELPDLYSCDMNTSNRTSRSNEDVSGLYTTNFTDNFRIIFKKGNVPAIDGLQLGNKIDLQVWNGFNWIQYACAVSAKYNKKLDYQSKKTILILTVDNTVPAVVIDSGSGGGVSQDYVDSQDQAVLQTATERIEEGSQQLTQLINGEAQARTDEDARLEGLIDALDATKAGTDYVQVSPTGTATHEVSYITIGEEEYKLAGGSFTQQQADWSQTDTSAVDYIKNKPSNLVTTNDIQEITGAKNFTGALTQNDDPVVTSSMLTTYATQTDLAEGLATREAVGACYTKHESDEEFAKYRTSNDQDVIDSNLSTAIATETSNRQSVDDSIRTEVTNEASRATSAEEGLQAQITGLSGTVKVEVVTTQPDTPVNGTMYYIGTANPYTVKLYTNNTWYEMGTTSVDLSGYAKLDGTNTTFTGDINLDGGAIVAGGNDVVKKMSTAVKVGDVSDSGVTVNTVYLKTKLDHAGITLQSNDDDGTATITAKNINLHGDNLTQVADGTAYNLLKSQTVNKVITLTQAEYEAIETKDPNTLYCVTDA